MKKCLNCGYERQPKDDEYGFIPSTECPKCRAIYEKVEKKIVHDSKKEDPQVELPVPPEAASLQKVKPQTSAVDIILAVCVVALTIFVGISLFEKKDGDKSTGPPKSTTHTEGGPPAQVESSNSQSQPLHAGRFDEKKPFSVSIHVSPQSDQQSITNLVRRIRSSVVLIQTNRIVGTGFFINHSGDVITNHHVMSGSDSARIKTADGNVYYVNSVLSEDKANDLAMLSVGIPPSEVNPLKVVSRYPEVGEKIIVVGNPVGLEQTVSDGIISGIRGDRYIQITAPISRGSSGGPVINMNGEVVCVVSFMATDVDSRKGNVAQNLNFCIPGEKVANLRPGVSYALSRMEPVRKVYCYVEDNGAVVFTENPQKVASYTLISKPDGTLDKAEYVQWVLKEMKLESSPEYFDVATEVQKTIDRDKDEIFRRAFPGKSRYSGMTTDEQRFWNDRLNQIHRDRTNHATAWKNRAVMRYQYMMNVFDRHQAAYR